MCVYEFECMHVMYCTHIYDEYSCPFFEITYLHIFIFSDLKFVNIELISKVTVNLTYYLLFANKTKPKTSQINLQYTSIMFSEEKMCIMECIISYSARKIFEQEREKDVNVFYC